MPHEDDRFQQVIQRLEHGSRQYFGVEEARITAVRKEIRPYSDLLRARVQSTSGTNGIYIKLGKAIAGGPSLPTIRSRFRRDFDTTSRVHRVLANDAAVSVVRPIACFDEPLAIVTEEVCGPNLLRVLETHAVRWRGSASALEKLETLFGHAGHWVRRFQEIEGGATTFSFDELIEYVDLRVQRLAADTNSSFTETDRRGVLQYLSARRGEIEPQDLMEVAIHGDFTPGNTLAAGPRVVVLDLTMTHRGVQLHDLARFYTQIDFLKFKPQFDRARIGRLQAALLRGFDPGLNPSHPMFQVLVLLHTVNHFGTLVTKRAPFPASAFNRFVASRHLGWIRRTIASAGA